MHEKRQKIEFSNLKYLLFSGMFLSGIGGYQIFKYSRYIFKGENVIYLWGGFPKSWQISLKKSLIFSLHNPVHAKCANFCFVGKEWPRNGYRFFPFFMPNQGGCFNLKCTGQQKAFFSVRLWIWGGQSKKDAPCDTEKKFSPCTLVVQWDIYNFLLRHKQIHWEENSKQIWRH